MFLFYVIPHLIYILSKIRKSAVILTGSECLYEDLQSFFPDENIFTLQGCTGAGGIDTFVMTFDTQKYIQDRLSNNCIYLVSPYQTKSYSVNIHVLFAQNDYYLITAYWE